MLARIGFALVDDLAQVHPVGEHLVKRSATEVAAAIDPAVLEDPLFG